MVGVMNMITGVSWSARGGCRSQWWTALTPVCGARLAVLTVVHQDVKPAGLPRATGAHQ